MEPIVEISSDEVILKNIKLVSGSNTSSQIIVNGKDSIIENVEVHGGYWAVEIYDKDAVISGSTFVGQTSAGVKVRAEGINTEITKSVMHSGDGYGIYVDLGALNVNINNNTMHNNSNSELDSRVMLLQSEIMLLLTMITGAFK